MKKGFTLIELSIVIMVIALLAAAFVPSLFGASTKSKDVARTSGSQKIASLLLGSSVADKITPGCVAPGSDLGGLIKPEDFGGKMPDPAGAEIKTGCKGYYVLEGDKSNPINEYSYGVFVKVEDPAAGNIDCGSGTAIDFSKNTAVMDSATYAVTDTGSCYAVLIQ